MAQHILVTGAAGAIGAALARAFRARHPGAHVTLVDLDETGASRVAQRIAGRVSVAVWDLSLPDGLPEAVAAVTEAHGPVDVLVSAAGVMDVRRFCQTPWELGERLLAVDLSSPLRLMSLVAPGMVERGSGAIVNVSSMAGVTPLRGCVYYGAAKAGLAHASEIARLELEPRGVRVITVYPGPVRSELERRARAQLPANAATELMPTGMPEPLAERVLAAYDSGAPRVVYPALYAVANRAPRIAGWITSRLSPMPLE